MKNTYIIIGLILLASCKKEDKKPPSPAPGPLLTNIKNYFTGPVSIIDTAFYGIDYDAQGNPAKYTYSYNKDLISTMTIRYSGNTMISTMPWENNGIYIDSIFNNGNRRPERQVTRTTQRGNGIYDDYVKNQVFTYYPDGTLKQTYTTFFDSTVETVSGIVKTKVFRDTTTENHIWENGNLKTINYVTVQYFLFKENGMITKKYDTRLTKKEDFLYTQQYPVPAKFTNPFLYSYLWWTASMIDPVQSTKIPDKSELSSSFRDPQGQVTNSTGQYHNCRILFNKLGLISKIEYDIDPQNKWVYEYTYR